MAETPEQALARYANPAEAGRAPSPGPDFTGMTPEETKKLRVRAGDRWTEAESEKIIDLRAAPKTMPWKQIAKIIGKTPLACRLRMNQIKKQEKRAAGIIVEPREKAERKSRSPKGKAKQTAKVSSPQAPRPLVPAEPQRQRPLPAFESIREASTFVPAQSVLQSRYLPEPSHYQGLAPNYSWQNQTHQQWPQQAYQFPDRSLERLNVLAFAADDANRRSIPAYHSQLPFRPVEETQHLAARQDSAANQEIASPSSGRKQSTIHGLLNEKDA